MPRFLIEVPHESETMACAQAIGEFLRSGSHFVANAEWGCRDGDHRAWIIAELDKKEEALQIVPPLYRARACVVELSRFSLREVEELLRTHGK